MTWSTARPIENLHFSLDAGGAGGYSFSVMQSTEPSRASGHFAKESPGKLHDTGARDLFGNTHA